MLRSAKGLGAYAAEQRELRGLTQSELASRVGVSREWVSRFERGRRVTLSCLGHVATPGAQCHAVCRNRGDPGEGTLRHIGDYMDGELAGEVIQTNTGKTSSTYDRAYSEQRSATPLSLSVPLGRQSHTQRTVLPFLQGLLPDSEGRLKQLGQEYGVSHNNPVALLEHVGSDAAGPSSSFRTAWAVQMLQKAPATSLCFPMTTFQTLFVASSRTRTPGALGLGTDGGVCRARSPKWPYSERSAESGRRRTIRRLRRIS